MSSSPGLSLFGNKALLGQSVPKSLPPTGVKSGPMRHNASAVQLPYRFHDIQIPIQPEGVNKGSLLP